MGISRLVEIKSKFGAEFRRFSFFVEDYPQYEFLYSLLERIHMLFNVPFVIQYMDPKSASLLPISNTKNLEIALNSSKSLLRILLQRKGQSYGELYGYKTHRHGLIHKDAASTLRNFSESTKRHSEKPSISLMSDFHLVSSILDVDIIPCSLRRVHLVRTPNKQFGLHIRTGTSKYFTKHGCETVPAFFIARLTNDGIARNTGLLAENDEIIEVNGIEVFGRSLDQVSDMMVANSSNLVITIRPADQSMCLTPRDSSTHLKYSHNFDIPYKSSSSTPNNYLRSSMNRMNLNTQLPNCNNIHSGYTNNNISSTYNQHHNMNTNTTTTNNNNDDDDDDDDMNHELITI